MNGSQETSRRGKDHVSCAGVARQWIVPRGRPGVSGRPNLFGRDGLMRRVLATAVVCIAVVSGVFIGCSSARAEIASVEPEIVTGSRYMPGLRDTGTDLRDNIDEVDQSGAPTWCPSRSKPVFLEKDRVSSKLR